MGGLLFGYEIGVVGQVLGMPSFQLFFNMAIDSPDATDASFKFAEGPNSVAMNQLTTFVFLAGCALGAAFSTVICDMFGRKKPIALGGVFFLAGAVFQTIAGNEGVFFIGRALSGIAIGVMSMCVPLFISETAPTEIRGRMTTVYQLMITIGIVIASVTNAIIIQTVQVKDFRDNLTWRLAISMQAVPAFILVLLCLVIPESPRWLADKDRNDEALAVIAKLRSSPLSEAKVQEEYKDIVDGVAFERTVGSGSWSEIFSPGILNRVVIACILQLFQQWTGINVIMYYGNDLYKAMGFSAFAASIPLPIIYNCVNMLMTFPGMYLIERMGRKKLLTYGAFLMAVSHILVCVWLNLGNSTGNSAFYFLAYINVLTFDMGFASTWGPVVWSYQSEIFPLRVRAKGTGLATMSNWVNNAVISYVAPLISKALERNLYIVFASTCVAMGVYAYFFVPETMGKSLEEMDDIFGSSGDMAKMELAASGGKVHKQAAVGH
ncbi:hypothetical protein HDV03_000009 [Kappamyces sp. JEL0829]|nr:hypothetical protein HDV03_000009 [Kappamyces sp. JEL0829]